MSNNLAPKKIFEMFNHLSDGKRSGMSEKEVAAEFYDFQIKVMFPLTTGSKRNDMDSIERVASHLDIPTQEEFERYVSMSLQKNTESVKQKAA